MIAPVRNQATKKSADHSTMEAFAFSFFCDRCGKEWRSARYAFNPGSFAAPMAPAIHQMLWNDQHRAAYERANRDASFAFNRCPICGRRVCNDCFYLAKAGVSDICKDCLGEMTLDEQTANGRSIGRNAVGPGRTPIRRVGADAR